MKSNWLVTTFVLVLLAAATAAEAETPWNDLSTEQRQVLAPFADSWADLPAERQDRLA